MLERPAEH